MTYVENLKKPSMGLGQKVMYSFAGGAIFTLATVLFENTAIMGALAYGFPFPWLAQSLYPIGGQMIFLFTGLILDILVWTIALFIVIKLYQVLRMEKVVTAFDVAQV